MFPPIAFHPATRDKSRLRTSKGVWHRDIFWMDWKIIDDFGPWEALNVICVERPRVLPATLTVVVKLENVALTAEARIFTSAGFSTKKCPHQIFFPVCKTMALHGLPQNRCPDFTCNQSGFQLPEVTFLNCLTGCVTPPNDRGSDPHHNEGRYVESPDWQGVTQSDSALGPHFGVLFSVCLARDSFSFVLCCRAVRENWDRWRNAHWMVWLLRKEAPSLLLVLATELPSVGIREPSY